MLTFKKQGALIFNLPQGKQMIDIEIADTPLKRQLGLMFRQVMQPHQGMLFLMKREEIQSFWMQNTYLSLDIMYVDSQREIVDIYPHTTPFSTVSLPSKLPAQYVVEVNAGFCEKHGIKIGTSINWTLKEA